MDVPKDFATQVREHLVVEGGFDARDAVGPSEAWRVRFCDATFTYYTKGTLYSTASPSQDPAVGRAWAFIDNGASPRFLPTDRELLIGLDETGKSEPIGHLVLAGALMPRVLSDEVEKIVGLAQTKRKHPDTYWDDLFTRLGELRVQGLVYLVEKVPPSDIDEYKTQRTHGRLLRAHPEPILIYC